MLKRSFLPILSFAFVVPLALPVSAAAQARAGDSEIQMFANFSMPSNDVDGAQGTIFVNVGRFVSDVLQIGGGPNIGISKGQGDFNPVTGEIEGGGIDARLGINAFVRRYFGVTRVQPYLGGEFFIPDVADADFTYANAIGGVKNYVSDRAAIDFKGGYGFLLKDPGSAGLVSFQVGLTVLF